MSRITAAEHVSIDENDIRQPLDPVEGEALDDLQRQFDDGELELCPGLAGWGRYNYTATHRETGTTYHVRLEK